ncbi:macrophage migration inhibitory factor [Elysia marginata]|uniref:Macrophage migration inhibitory factor n=1 Tax=Elysia marginata TaxID=1093978 RepID=A0AAV4HMV9_9GAST|nr:macrophage migration inhibitory factor [Elysia marginata]
MSSIVGSSSPPPPAYSNKKRLFSTLFLLPYQVGLQGEKHPLCVVVVVVVVVVTLVTQVGLQGEKYPLCVVVGTLVIQVGLQGEKHPLCVVVVTLVIQNQHLEPVNVFSFIYRKEGSGWKTPYTSFLQGPASSRVYLGQGCCQLRGRKVRVEESRLVRRESRMSKISVAGFASTNVDKLSVKDGFLSSCSIMLAKLFHTAVELISLELQTNITMVRAGSSLPMLNIRLFHNSDRVDSDTKHNMAKTVASWMAREIGVSEDRVLVLFIDTRLCNAA